MALCSTVKYLIYHNKLTDLIKTNKKINMKPVRALLAQQKIVYLSKTLTLGAGGSLQNIPRTCNWPHASQICRFWYTAETDGGDSVGGHSNSSKLRLIFKYILQTCRLGLLKEKKIKPEKKAEYLI